MRKTEADKGGDSMRTHLQVWRPNHCKELWDTKDWLTILEKNYTAKHNLHHDKE